MTASSSTCRRQRLWRDQRVLITPHVSGASDDERHRAIDLFCDNLRAYLDGKPLQNVIDWERGIEGRLTSAEPTPARADIGRGRPDQPAGLALLHRVREPAGGAPPRKPA